MSRQERVIIRHEDGRQYSVTKDAFQKRYADLGFTIEKVEEPADFVADVPAPRRSRRPPRRKG